MRSERKPNLPKESYFSSGKNKVPVQAQSSQKQVADYLVKETDIENQNLNLTTDTTPQQQEASFSIKKSTEEESVSEIQLETIESSEKNDCDQKWESTVRLDY